MHYHELSPTSNNYCEVVWKSSDERTAVPCTSNETYDTTKTCYANTQIAQNANSHPTSLISNEISPMSPYTKSLEFPRLRSWSMPELKEIQLIHGLQDDMENMLSSQPDDDTMIFLDQSKRQHNHPLQSLEHIDHKHLSSDGVGGSANHHHDTMNHQYPGDSGSDDFMFFDEYGEQEFQEQEKDSLSHKGKENKNSQHFLPTGITSGGQPSSRNDETEGTFGMKDSSLSSSTRKSLKSSLHPNSTIDRHTSMAGDTVKGEEGESVRSSARERERKRERTLTKKLQRLRKNNWNPFKSIEMNRSQSSLNMRTSSSLLASPFERNVNMYSRKYESTGNSFNSALDLSFHTSRNVTSEGLDATYHASRTNLLEGLDQSHHETAITLGEPRPVDSGIPELNLDITRRASNLFISDEEVKTAMLSEDSSPVVEVRHENDGPMLTPSEDNNHLNCLKEDKTDDFLPERLEDDKLTTATTSTDITTLPCGHPTTITTSNTAEHYKCNDDSIMMHSSPSQQKRYDPPAMKQPRRSILRRSSMRSSTPSCPKSKDLTSSMKSNADGDTVSTSDLTLSFSTLEIREYYITLGDNPGGTHGPPISLSNDYCEDRTFLISIDKYEETRPPRRAKNELYMSGSIRVFTLLKELGYSIKEIQEATKTAQKIRKKRRKSIRSSPIQKMGLTVGHIFQRR